MAAVASVSPFWAVRHCAGGPTPATVTETEAAVLPRGDLPIIGDPIRDLTIWWSNRLTDANRAGLDSLRGRALTPIDPMADEVIKTLYGKILLITIPLLTLGGMILGYLIMTSRTTGESAYTARAVTPRFVVGATLSVLGIFLVSVLAQFVTATDLAMVGVSIPERRGRRRRGLAGRRRRLRGSSRRRAFSPGSARARTTGTTALAVGRPGGDGADASSRWSTRAVGVERLLILVGPICLAAYALPAPRINDTVAQVLLGSRRSVRVTIVFVLFSLERSDHRPDGNPPTVATLTRCSARHRLRPAHVPLAVRDPPAAISGPDRSGPRLNERGLVEVPENAVRDEPIAFGSRGPSASAAWPSSGSILTCFRSGSDPARPRGSQRGTDRPRRRAAGPGRTRLSLDRPRSPIPPRFAVLERNTREPR